jgi:sigma-E factor negative regulatory protein RseA
MTDKVDELMSAFLDGETSPQESDRVVAALKSEEALRARWERFHLARAAMKRELPADLATGLAKRVNAGLDAEPAILVPPRVRKTHGVRRHVATFAVAASLTAVAILGIQRFADEGRNPVTGNQVASAPQQGEWVRAAGTRWNLSQPAVESKLNGYVVNHNEHATAAGMRGMLPYARIAGYDTEPRD